MPDDPTFEQLLAWVLEADDEETFAEWLARQEKEEKPSAQ